MAHNAHKNTFGGQGNLAMAKFSALMNVNRCFQFVKDAKPSKDTARWREGGDHRLYRRQDGKHRLKLRNVEKENKKLSERIYTIMTDDREKRTVEYAPGLRIGKAGVVVDCYQHAGLNAKIYRELHSRSASWAKEALEIKKDNEILKGNISKLKSDLAPSALEKEYKKNRYMNRMLLQRPSQTVLHLGLVKNIGKLMEGLDKASSSANDSNNNDCNNNTSSTDDDATGAVVAGGSPPPTNHSSSRNREDRVGNNALSVLYEEADVEDRSASRGSSPLPVTTGTVGNSHIAPGNSPSNYIKTTTAVDRKEKKEKKASSSSPSRPASAKNIWTAISRDLRRQGKKKERQLSPVRSSSSTNAGGSSSERQLNSSNNYLNSSIDHSFHEHASSYSPTSKQLQQLQQNNRSNGLGVIAPSSPSPTSPTKRDKHHHSSSSSSPSALSPSAVAASHIAGMSYSNHVHNPSNYSNYLSDAAPPSSRPLSANAASTSTSTSLLGKSKSVKRHIEAINKSNSSSSIAIAADNNTSKNTINMSHSNKVAHEDKYGDKLINSNSNSNNSTGIRPKSASASYGVSGGLKRANLTKSNTNHATGSSSSLTSSKDKGSADNLLSKLLDRTILEKSRGIHLLAPNPNPSSPPQRPFSGGGALLAPFPFPSNRPSTSPNHRSMRGGNDDYDIRRDFCLDRDHVLTMDADIEWDRLLDDIDGGAGAGGGRRRSREGGQRGNVGGGGRGRVDDDAFEMYMRGDIDFNDDRMYYDEEDGEVGEEIGIPDGLGSLMGGSISVNKDITSIGGGGIDIIDVNDYKEVDVLVEYPHRRLVLFESVLVSSLVLSDDWFDRASIEVGLEKGVEQIFQKRFPSSLTFSIRISDIGLLFPQLDKHTRSTCGGDDGDCNNNIDANSNSKNGITLTSSKDDSLANNNNNHNNHNHNHISCTSSSGKQLDTDDSKEFDMTHDTAKSNNNNGKNTHNESPSKSKAKSKSKSSSPRIINDNGNIISPDDQTKPYPKSNPKSNPSPVPPPIHWIPLSIGIFVEANLLPRCYPDYLKMRQLRDRLKIATGRKSPDEVDAVTGLPVTDSGSNSSSYPPAGPSLTCELFIPLQLIHTIATYFNNRSVLQIISRCLNSIGTHTYQPATTPSPPSSPLNQSNSKDANKTKNVNIGQELAIFPCLSDALSAEERNLVLSMLLTSIDVRYYIDRDAIGIELKT